MTFRPIAMLSVLLVATHVLGQAPDPAAQAAVNYNQIISQLDQQGDVLIVLNMQDVLRDAMNDLQTFVNAIPADDRDAAAAVAAVQRLPAFLEKQGLNACRGWGMSSKPTAGGMHTVKSYVARDAAARNAPLWRACFGGEPRTLKGPTFLPADTALAVAGQGEVGALWAVVKSAVSEFGGPAAAGAFDAGVAQFNRQANLDLEKLIASMGDEGFVSVQLARDVMVSIPAAGQPIQIAQPALLMGRAVRDSAILDALVAVLKTNGVPMTVASVEGTTIYSLNLPIPAPFPVQPALAQVDGFLLFGSSPAVITDALRIRAGGAGLGQDAEFAAAFRGLPMENNSMAYVSDRFMQLVATLQSAGLADLERQNPEGARALRDLIQKRTRGQQTTVAVNQPDGVYSVGVSSWGGKQMIGSALMAPAGMLAGIAVPSFAKARHTSRQNACIGNLRLLDSAKEQWAMSENKSDGAEVEEAGVLQYIKGARMPVCPRGGTYTLNPIGVDPECSIPGHSLYRR